MAKTDFGFDKTEESTGFLLWQVTNLWQREIKKALEKIRFDTFAICITCKYSLANIGQTKCNANFVIKPY